MLARLLLCLTGRIKWMVKRANWVETHSARLTIRFHLHIVIQKHPVLIKWAKIW